MEERFAFGENWAKFLKKMNPERIRDAEESLTKWLGDVKGKTFLDIGSGSGLFSLAARNLGAWVTSFDYDPDSVRCTQKLKERFHADDETWPVFKGSALDRKMLAGLGKFDIVYSWGVLHHTGKMWEAMDNAAVMVRDKGLLYISIYNDQGGYSERWKRLKRFYLSVPPRWQPLFAGTVLFFRELRPLLSQILRLKNPIAYWKARKQSRGMSYWTDWIDWIGGYPFEVAKPEDVFEFFKGRGFTLMGFTTNRCEASCNEFVFKKVAVD